ALSSGTRRHTILQRAWSSDVFSSDPSLPLATVAPVEAQVIEARPQLSLVAVSARPGTTAVHTPGSVLTTLSPTQLITGCSVSLKIGRASCRDTVHELSVTV